MYVNGYNFVNNGPIFNCFITLESFFNIIDVVGRVKRSSLVIQYSICIYMSLFWLIQGSVVRGVGRRCLMLVEQLT